MPKRSALDPADRAAGLRLAAQYRIPLPKLGFDPRNRGGVGISAFHVHEVCWDCLSNKVRLKRYGAVEVVRIPPSLLSSVRAKNIKMAQDEPLLPAASEEILYVTVSKTHFTHAVKLALEKNRTLFNKQKVPIEIRGGDDEWKEILANGPLCIVYDAELYLDLDAVEALRNEDNLNASIEMKADELQVLGRICALVSTDITAKRGGSAAAVTGTSNALENAAEKPAVAAETRASAAAEAKTASAVTAAAMSTAVTAEGMIARVRQLGAITFTDEELEHLIRFRASLQSELLATAFLQSQWALTQGRIRVKCSDFGILAAMDPRGLWCRVAVAMRQYVGALNAVGDIGFGRNFGGRSEMHARRLSGKGFEELSSYPEYVHACEAVIKGVFKQYQKHVDAGDASKVLRARARLLSDVGKFILIAVSGLEKNVNKRAAGVAVASAETDKFLVETLATCKANAEDKFRQLLAEAGAAALCF